MAPNILIIEDDRSVAQLLEDVLKRKGYSVQVEADGEWGLQAFLRKGADLILVDVLVPKLVGFDLVAQVRQSEKGARVPIIVLSGVYRAATHSKMLIDRFQISAYFDKPVDLDQLLAAVERALSPESPAPSEKPPAPTDDTPSRMIGGQSKVPAKGSLDQLPLARLLGELYQARCTGALMLRRSTFKKIVCLKQGIPVFVKSNLIDETLGRIMVREKLISPEECDRSIERMKAENRQQGTILVEMGSISPHNLAYALERQLEIKLFDLFSWTDGQYLLHEGGEYSGTQVALSMGPTELIYEAVRRTMSNEMVERELRRIETRVVHRSDDPTFRYQAIQIDARTERLFATMDGHHTLRQVLTSADFNPHDAARLLYAFSCTGLLKLNDTPLPTLGQKSWAKEVLTVDDADVELLRTGEVSSDAILGRAPARDSAPAVGAQAPPSSPRPRLSQVDQLWDDNVGEGEDDPSVALRAEQFNSPARAAAADDHALTAGEQASTGVLPMEAEVIEAKRPVASSSAPTKEKRSSRGPPASAVVPAAAAAPEPDRTDGVLPPMSADLRAQIRARLEAQAAAFKPSQTPRRASRPPAPSLVAPATRRPSVSQDTEEISVLDVKEERGRMQKSLDEKLQRLKRKNYYELLGLHRHATLEAITAAYERVAHECDPERVLPGQFGLETRALAEEIAVLIRRAFSTLKNPHGREEYERTLANDEPTRARMILAEAAYLRAQIHVRDADWVSALSELKEATELNPDEGAYLAHRAWAEFFNASDDPEVAKRALAELDRALEKSPRLEDAYVFRGLIQERLGERTEAIRELKRALTHCNPDSTRALRALRSLAPAAPKRQGIFRMFGSG